MTPEQRRIADLEQQLAHLVRCLQDVSLDAARWRAEALKHRPTEQMQEAA